MKDRFAQSYSEVEAARPFQIRGHLRRMALGALVLRDKLYGIESDLAQPRVQFLYVHHVFADEENAFRKLLTSLQKHHEFIAYSKAVDLILMQKVDRPLIVISSDDGFKNNLRAAKILEEFGISGCFFVNPFTIDNLPFEVLKNFCKQKLNFPPVEFLNWSDVEELQKRGHEIGSHTMTHVNLAKLAEEALRDEIATSYEIIKRRCGEPLHFAYPYGRFFHFNELAKKIVFETGYRSCASAERGCHVNLNYEMKLDDLLLLRDHVLLSWPLDHIKYFLAKNSRAARGISGKLERK